MSRYAISVWITVTQQDASATAAPPTHANSGLMQNDLRHALLAFSKRKKPKTWQIKHLNPLIWWRDVTEIASGSVDKFAKDFFFSSITAKLFWSLTKQHLYSNHIMLQFAAYIEQQENALKEIDIFVFGTSDILTHVATDSDFLGRFYLM